MAQEDYFLALAQMFLQGQHNAAQGSERVAASLREKTSRTEDIKREQANRAEDIARENARWLEQKDAREAALERIKEETKGVKLSNEGTALQNKLATETFATRLKEFETRAGLLDQQLSDAKFAGSDEQRQRLIDNQDITADLKRVELRMLQADEKKKEKSSAFELSMLEDQAAKMRRERESAMTPEQAKLHQRLSTEAAILANEAARDSIDKDRMQAMASMAKMLGDLNHDPASARMISTSYEALLQQRAALIKAGAPQSEIDSFTKLASHLAANLAALSEKSPELAQAKEAAIQKLVKASAEMYGRNAGGALAAVNAALGEANDDLMGALNHAYGLKSESRPSPDSRPSGLTDMIVKPKPKPEDTGAADVVPNEAKPLDENAIAKENQQEHFDKVLARVNKWDSKKKGEALRIWKFKYPDKKTNPSLNDIAWDIVSQERNWLIEPDRYPR